MYGMHKGHHGGYGGRGYGHGGCGCGHPHGGEYGGCGHHHGGGPGGCGHGWGYWGGGEGPGFGRRFYSREERINDLEEYLKNLEAEAQGVREVLEHLRGGGQSSQA
ncbi:MAG: hypothetical protein M0Z94_05305 [Dehalococcoidales bacterium]|nr:hypothetical protein [Dehalococcoidales bacterium]